LKDRVILRNFWENEDTTKKFIFNLLSGANHSKNTLIVSSVFLRRPLYKRVAIYLYNRIAPKKFNFSLALARYNLASPIKKNNTKNIWYTGENIRPPYDTDWDLLLSFEVDESYKKNLFLPFWATTLGNNVYEAEEKQNQLLLPRNLQLKQKKFACAIIGNPEPMRMRIIDEISKVGNVDLFGTAFNKPIQDKNEIISEYYFNICFENDLYPNYVTEKLFDSWSSGAIPIWWGLDDFGYINDEAVINFYGTKFSTNMERLSYLKGNHLEILKIINKPILVKPFNYKMLLSKVNEYLNNE
jgi:hypothetical protein